MLHHLKTIFFYCGLALAIVLNGCSLSTSSGSLSKSSGSFSTSIQSSSHSSTSLGSKGGAQYQDEVQDYTSAYLKSTSSAATDYNSFLKGLSTIAADNGIANWEADMQTYQGIGKGLKKAGIQGISYETYKKNFAGSDSAKMNAIQQGYDSLD